MIGREQELSCVSSLLDDVAGRLAVLVVEGGTGMGKSSFLGEAVRLAGGRGFRVLAAHPARPDADLSFSGLADLLGAAALDDSVALPTPQRRALEVALLLRDPEGEPTGALAVRLAVLGMLSALAAQGPVLLAVDDAQWLDRSSAEAVGFAVRRLADSPIGLLVVGRTDTATPVDLPVLLGLPREMVRRVRLEPLGRDDVGRLLRESLGLPLTGAELDRLHRACGGNPLFSLEVGRGLTRGAGLRSDEPVPIPADLAALFRDRLAGLSPATRDVLLAVAAASEVSAGAAVASVDVAPIAAVATAVAEGILERCDGGVRFAHPLVASVLMADATEDERRALHRRLAVVAEGAEERARHLALAAAGPDAAAALTLEDAARAARHRGAPCTAADLAEQAAGMTPAGVGDDRARRALLAADAHLDAGELERAEELLDGLLSTLPHGATRAAALERLGWVRYHRDGWTAASDLLGAAAREAGDDEALAAAIDLDESVARFLSGDVPGAAAFAESALRRAGTIDDPAFLAGATAVAASIDFLRGKGLEHDDLIAAVGNETWSRPRPTMQHPSVAFGVLLKWADEIDASRVQLEAARQRATDEGTERSLPFILFHLAELECWAGNWSTAAVEARQAADVAEGTGQDTGRAFALGAVAMVAALHGNVDEARTTAGEGLALAREARALPAGVLLESVLGFVELSVRDAGRAYRHLQPLVERAVDAGIYEPGALRYLGDGLEALVGVGDIELATRLTDELTLRSEELDRAWGLMVAARGRGMLCSAAGDLSGAQAAFEQALEIHERLGQPFELGRTMLALGIARRRDRQKRPAREALERSLEIFQELGADLWAAHAGRELERIGGRTTSAVSLTPTEERIARMVADGATNKEVAAQLFLSVKTVEWNLSRMYRKVGVRSRTELARWIAAPGPMAAPAASGWR